MDSKLFYSKCRPQGADAWPIAKDAGRVFVGYPVFRALDDGTPLSGWRRGVHSMLVDPRDPDWDGIQKTLVGRGYKAQITANRNLTRSIGEGSIALVPRVADGVCHAGHVSASFELVDEPGWATDYLRLRADSGLRVQDEDNHVADVVQTWPVSEWVTLPFPALPRWISYRLLSRNTAGVIRDLEDPEVSAVECIRELMARRHETTFQAIDQRDLERKLLDWLTPSSFEHLVVSLLQLEAPDGLYWHHVGGSGDGGVDGIAVDAEGRLRARLQCKWHYAFSARRLQAAIEISGVRGVVAILMGSQELPDGMDPSDFVNRKRVATLLRKHKDRLPMARSLGL